MVTKNMGRVKMSRLLKAGVALLGVSVAALLCSVITVMISASSNTFKVLEAVQAWETEGLQASPAWRVREVLSRLGVVHPPRDPLQECGVPAAANWWRLLVRSLETRRLLACLEEQVQKAEEEHAAFTRNVLSLVLLVDFVLTLGLFVKLRPLCSDRFCGGAKWLRSAWFIKREGDSDHPNDEDDEQEVVAPPSDEKEDEGNFLNVEGQRKVAPPGDINEDEGDDLNGECQRKVAPSGDANEDEGEQPKLENDDNDKSKFATAVDVETEGAEAQQGTLAPAGEMKYHEDENEKDRKEVQVQDEVILGGGAQVWHEGQQSASSPRATNEEEPQPPSSQAALDQVTVLLEVPPDMRRHVVGRGGRTIRMILEDHPSVRVTVPDARDVSSQRVTFHGPWDNVAYVVACLTAHLQKVWRRLQPRGGRGRRGAKKEDRKAVTDTVTVHLQVPVDMVRHVVGRGGSTLRMIWENHPTVRVTVRVPDSRDSPSQSVILEGPWDSVADVAAWLIHHLQVVQRRLQPRGARGRRGAPRCGAAVPNH